MPHAVANDGRRMQVRVGGCNGRRRDLGVGPSRPPVPITPKYTSNQTGRDRRMCMAVSVAQLGWCRQRRANNRGPGHVRSFVQSGDPGLKVPSSAPHLVSVPASGGWPGRRWHGVWRERHLMLNSCPANRLLRWRPNFLLETNRQMMTLLPRKAIDRWPVSGS
jgi:hypothetical protein